MIVYIDSASFSNATSVFLDELLTIIAPDGYYSDDSYYRQQIDGKLIDLLPCVGIYTVSITAVGETTATFNGNLINNGGDVNAVRGFVYGTSTNPTTSNSVITDTVMAQGTYSLNVTGLTTGVTYYVRAYTIVFGETIYGDELSFTTVATANLTYVNDVSPDPLCGSSVLVTISPNVNTLVNITASFASGGNALWNSGYTPEAGVTEVYSNLSNDVVSAGVTKKYRYGIAAGAGNTYTSSITIVVKNASTNATLATHVFTRTHDGTQC
jgi:hypothetical protein